MTLEETKKLVRSGALYSCDNDELAKDQLKVLQMLAKYNRTKPLQQKKREKLLKKMFAEIGEGCYIEPPFHSNWAGNNVHFGNKVYANFNLTLVDDADIYVGDSTMFGPNVTICTAGHPINAKLREQVFEFNMPIHIGKNVWIGSNVVVLPGVSIGDNSVIGAGSIVTKDIPANVVAFGTPCVVQREISERDDKFYYKNLTIDPALLED